jgi:hypothetical protein
MLKLTKQTIYFLVLNPIKMIIIKMEMEILLVLVKNAKLRHRCGHFSKIAQQRDRGKKEMDMLSQALYQLEYLEKKNDSLYFIFICYH